MNSTDLLARENEFRKLNKQLEKKTESLMKEIENVMQKQDVFSDISRKLRITPSPKNVIKHHCNSAQSLTLDNRNKCINQMNSSNRPNTTKNRAKKNFKNEIEINDETIVDKQQNTCHSSTLQNYNCSKDIICHNCMLDKNGRLSDDIEFLYAFVSINVNDNILPQSFLKERVTVESVCKFLSAKVKLLQEQLTKMQTLLEKKGQQCDGHLAQLAELEGERMTLLNRANKAKADAAESKAKYMAIQGQLEEKERAHREQRGAADRLAAELKQARGRCGALEGRCAAHQGAEAALRHQLAAAEATHQEFRDSSRQLSASHEGAISRLEARIKQLTSCAQKQHALIDNLKMQNTLLTMQGATASLEAEYNDFLKRDL